MWNTRGNLSRPRLRRRWASRMGTLTRAHEFSPEVVGYIDPDLRDADVVAFMVGEQGEYPAWFFLAGERFEDARQMERDALVIAVGDLKLIVEPLDEPEKASMAGTTLFTPPHRENALDGAYAIAFVDLCAISARAADHEIAAPPVT
jgi:hypothetical protein